MNEQLFLLDHRPAFVLYEQLFILNSKLAYRYNVIYSLLGRHGCSAIISLTEHLYTPITPRYIHTCYDPVAIRTPLYPWRAPSMLV